MGKEMTLPTTIDAAVERQWSLSLLQSETGMTNDNNMGSSTPTEAGELPELGGEDLKELSGKMLETGTWKQGLDPSFLSLRLSRNLLSKRAASSSLIPPDSHLRNM